MPLPGPDGGMGRGRKDEEEHGRFGGRGGLRGGGLKEERMMAEKGWAHLVTFPSLSQDETNNWEKAEAVWTKMQEENVIPRERTQRMLADILRNNGQEVPFDIPETWYEQAGTTQKDMAVAESATTLQTRLLALCKRGNTKEAFGLLTKIDKNGVALGPAPYDHLIRALLAKGDIDDAMVVKD
ncbi:leucine-rich PPR motif-containing protein, mitochondrial, partial [Lates japonicus]